MFHFLSTLVEFKDKRAVAVLDRVVLDGIVQCLGFLGFCRRLLAIYLTSSVVKYWIGCWIYEIYVDLLIAE